MMMVEGNTLKVYLDKNEEKQLIGRADVPADAGAVWEVSLFGPASVIRETYTLGTVTHFRPGQVEPFVERVVLLAPGQPPEFLPGWQPLAS